MKNLKNHHDILKAFERAKSLPLIIVEGKKDKEALTRLGFQNIIILHHDKVPLYSILDKIECKECAILTDFDRKGKLYYSTIRRELTKKGIKVNDELRKMLIKERISHIEGLTTFIKNNNLLI